MHKDYPSVRRSNLDKPRHRVRMTRSSKHHTYVLLCDATCSVHDFIDHDQPGQQLPRLIANLTTEEFVTERDRLAAEHNVRYAAVDLVRPCP